ncbi:MAG: DUF5106 domain-containing protein [Bacteroidales bacterium]|nr:DUF5106 domain-containing protein [Bacteroidales bacterium]
MKKTFLLLGVLLTLSVASMAQAYKIGFSSPSINANDKYYLGQHFRDKYIIVDSAVAEAKTLTFQGKQKMNRGIYALLNAKKEQQFDFIVDDSQKFTISFDEKHSAPSMKATGSKNCQMMFDYMAKLDYGNTKAKEIQELAKTNKEQSDAQMKGLQEEMNTFLDAFRSSSANTLFGQIMSNTERVKVPEAIPEGSSETNLQNWQAIYYRTHYWDNVNLKDHSLIYTPQLFEKMNLYFFGVLYYQDADTITKYAYNVLDKVVDDSTMLRYFLDFIVPKYEHATKNIGWDQVFVNLTEHYYLSGKCPWSSEADRYSRYNTVEYLKPSLIGHFGTELLMADSNQSNDPNDWISSHYFPERYVILWFWDPDCSHCKTQSEELKQLYNKMTQEGNRRFEVYAIGYESDVNKWKRTFRERNYPFVNVGGSNVNVDYQAAYNVHSAPTMIILDCDREIILNKSIQSTSIIPFLDQYEKQHPEKATKVTKWMRPSKYYQNKQH